MHAQIDKEGNIRATTNTEVTSPMPDGVTQVKVPDDYGPVRGDRHKYNLETKSFEKLPPRPLPIEVQLCAALVQNGSLKHTDFHPETMKAVNRALTEAGKPEISLT